jgi:hypothetical protein
MKQNYTLDVCVNRREKIKKRVSAPTKHLEQKWLKHHANIGVWCGINISNTFGAKKPTNVKQTCIDNVATPSPAM